MVRFERCEFVVCTLAHILRVFVVNFQGRIEELEEELEAERAMRGKV